MTAVILGTAPGMPVPGKSHSAFWCKTGKRNVLFDCGEGTAQRLMEHNLDGEVTDCIVISHFHPDHVSGIFMVLQMLYLQNRKKPLDIYLPENAAGFSEVLNMFYLFPERLSYRINLHDVQDIADSIPEIIPIKNDHLKNYEQHVNEHGHPNLLNSYSFLIDTGGKRILYTSDIWNKDRIKDYIEDSDTIIIDAIHPPKDEIIDIVRRTDKEIILIHGISQKLQEALENDKTIRAVIAEDGHTIES